MTTNPSRSPASLVVQSWQNDPDFQALPDQEKARIALNYFDKRLSDDKFLALPEPEQKRIKLNFLHKSDLAIPSDMVETSVSAPVSPPWKVRKAIPQGGEMFDLVRNGIDVRTGSPPRDLSVGISGREPTMTERVREAQTIPGVTPPRQAMEPSEIAGAQIAREAQRIPIQAGGPMDLLEEAPTRQLPREKYIAQAYPQGAGVKRAEQIGKDIQAGALGTVEGAAGFLEWLSNGKIGRETANHIAQVTRGLAPEDPNFADALAMGAGSTATFFIPGIGVAGTASRVAQVAPRVSRILGASTMAVMEAATEAGDVYRNARQKGMERNAADDAASKTFWLNMPLLLVTNKLGIFGETGRRLQRALISAAMEGAQEAGQYEISRRALDEKFKLKDALTSIGVGAIIGGGAGAAVPSFTDRRRQAEAGPQPRISQTVEPTGQLPSPARTYAGPPEEKIEVGEWEGTIPPPQPDKPKYGPSGLRLKEPDRATVEPPGGPEIPLKIDERYEFKLMDGIPLSMRYMPTPEIRTKKGKPFIDEAAAKRVKKYLKIGDEWEISPFMDGFVLKMKPLEMGEYQEVQKPPPGPGPLFERSQPEPFEPELQPTPPPAPAPVPFGGRPSRSGGEVETVEKPPVVISKPEPREDEFEARVAKLKAEMASLGEQVRRAKKKFQSTDAEQRMIQIASEIDRILKKEFPDLAEKWSQTQRDYLDRLKEIQKKATTTKPSEAQATPAPKAPEAQASLEPRIREAYSKISGGKENVRVLLSDLRKELPDVPRETLDAELLRMQGKGRGVTLMRLDDPQQRTKEIEAAALDIIGEKRHLVYMEGGGQQAPQTERPEDAESGIKPEEPTERPIPRAFREGQTGNKATVFTPRNNQLDVQYGVVEADDLIVSHDLRGRPNPAYPPEIQPRDRSRVMSELQINGIRQKMVVEHPELLGDMADTDRGGPLIGEDFVVEGGNGRTLAIQSAYQRGESQAYRDMVKSRAEALGIDPALVDQMERPVLVRIRKGEVADRAELARELNESGAARMSPSEQAKMDAARLRDEDLFLLNPDESGSLTAASNRGFIKRFLERMGPSERSGMLDSDGRPTRQLVDRMQAAVFDKVYKDPRLIPLMAEDVNPGIKNILNALTKAAPRFITAFRGGEPNTLKQMDITPHIADAVNLVLEARNRQVDSVDLLLRQQTLFGSQYDPTAEALARFFDKHKRSAKALTIGLESMADQIQKEGQRALNKNLFGETPVKTPAQIVEQAQADVQKAYEKPDQGDLFSKTGPTERKVTAEDEDFIRKLYAGVPIPEMVSEAKKAFASGIIDEDISKRLELTAIPSWLAKKYPVFKPFREIQKRRDYNRNLIRHVYSKMLEPAFSLKDKQSLKRVGAILWRGDAAKKAYSDNDLIRYGLNQEERAAYQAAREVLDTIWKEDMPDLMNSLGFSESEIGQFRRSVGNVTGYMPHPRQGRWFVRIRQDDEVVWREHFDDILGALTRGKYLWKAPLKKAALEKLGGQIEFGENKKIPEDLFFNISPQITEEIINMALNRADVKGNEDVLRRAIEEAIADMFKARGFMAHGLKRRGVPGFDASNWQDALAEYLSSWAGFKSKLLAAEEIKKLWGKVDWAKVPNLRAYTDKYIRDAFVNADQHDRAIDKARAFFFYKYLGGIVKSAALNLTQTYITVIPRLSAETKWAGVKVHHEMLKTLKDVMALAVTKTEPGKTSRYETVIGKRLTEEELAGLSRAMNTGVVADLLTQELMAINLGKYGDNLRHVSNGLRFMFGKTEIFNRITTWLTAFRIAKNEKGMNTAQAWDWADSIVEETHFDYGKSNLPPFIRGKAGRFLRPFYTFRTYTDQLVRGVWHDFLTNEEYGPIKGKIAFMKSILALMFFGGLGGFPLYESIEALITKLTGKNVGAEAAKRAGDYSEYVLYGMPALFGVDLTGSISIEAPTSIEDVLGIPASLVRDSVNTYKDLKGGDYYRAVEDFPLNFQVVSNAMKANRMTDRGQQTRTGKVIFDDEGEPIKMTGVEAAGKILGFQPTRISEGYRKYSARQDVLDYWQAKKDGLSAKFVLARQNKGPQSKEAKEAYKNIVEFNKSRPKFVAPIDFRRIIRSRTMDRPSRREQLLLREVQ